MEPTKAEIRANDWHRRWELCKIDIGPAIVFLAGVMVGLFLLSKPHGRQEARIPLPASPKEADHAG